ncbi:hypothetical protein [Uliginosibacterium sp. H1]|uniref:hypothetical protein n=1 Tax=Uliginosibacterium sp. H1 TaxID=3114757 RepID=UPI002E18C536|nr:hypothetical protein [Uliginosibacterium sp. H1]
MMKPKVRLYLLVVPCMLFGFCMNAFAQHPPIVGITKGVKELPLYASVDDLKPSMKIAASALPLPLEVIAVQGDFLKVRLQQGELWLEGADVIVERRATIVCAPAANKPRLTAATQNAGNNCI